MLRIALKRLTRVFSRPLTLRVGALFHYYSFMLSSACCPAARLVVELYAVQCRHRASAGACPLDEITATARFFGLLPCLRVSLDQRRQCHADDLAYDAITKTLALVEEKRWATRDLGVWNALITVTIIPDTRGVSRFAPRWRSRCSQRLSSSMPAWLFAAATTPSSCLWQNLLFCRLPLVYTFYRPS